MCSATDMRTSGVLGDWPKERIDETCRRAYVAYERALWQRYLDYFARNPRKRHREHPLLARDVASALPDGHADLQHRIARADLHRWHLSGKSSQILALGLLGAAEADGYPAGLIRALGLPRSALRMEPAFEARVSPNLLSEHPRATTIDYLIETETHVVCLEAKWSEAGVGACGCSRKRGRSSEGGCAQRVVDRVHYWNAGRKFFGFAAAPGEAPCELRSGYQLVRNVAAAVALAADGRVPVVVLAYDVNNPYFAQTDSWPGWPWMLENTLGGRDDLVFGAISWQELLPALSLDDAACAWAAEKHGLRTVH